MRDYYKYNPWQRSFDLVIAKHQKLDAEKQANKEKETQDKTTATTTTNK